MQTLTLLHCGMSERLRGMLDTIPVLRAAEQHPAAALPMLDLNNRTLLFCVAVDEWGQSEVLSTLLRSLRQRSDCLEGARAAVVIDGTTELDTKDIARRLIFAANLAGCAFPGKPLVEATGSLRNLAVLQKKHGLESLEATYRFALEALIERLCSFAPPKKAQPRLLMLHASDRSTSNTLALGERVAAQLAGIELETISLRNGTIHDCRGCSFKVCSHYAAQGSCFYGGAINEQVLPALLRSDGLLLLCPNYNDAVGANIMAFINRMTSLTVSNALYGRSLYAVVVSGYSGGDIVAQQLLGALCLNKAFSLPPRFCLIETANDPGEALRLPGIEEKTTRFAAQIQRWFL